MSGFWGFYWNILDNDDASRNVILNGNCQCEIPGWTFFKAGNELSGVNVHVPCSACCMLVGKERKKDFLVRRKATWICNGVEKWERRHYLKK